MIPNTNENAEYKVGINHEIQMLPIEDIISMKISTEVNKAVETVKSVALIPSPPTEKLTCYQKMKNVVCCKKKKNEPEPKYDIKTKEKQKATRTIIVTIEYIRYKIVFHYLNNEIFDENEYKIQLEECETLARLIVQLKGMNSHYPNEEQLQNIVQQHRIRHFGQIINQDIPVL
ncbi:hypothetical protein I4U23_011530 [Adineta vaga]|nr:hypothetical protein I4U23_011530 [Adineta vaga]